MQKSIILIVAMTAFQQIAFAGEQTPIATGEWSKPVADSRAYALRGRLVLCERVISDERHEFAIFVELQDATDSIGQGMRLYCDMGKTDFRPEYKGGLSCELVDGNKKPVATTGFPFGGAVPKSEWVSLPTQATIRLRASPFGIHRPKAKAICPHLGQMWVIADNDPKDYFLSGKFTIDPEEGKKSVADPHIWRGTLDLPSLKITNKRP